MNPTAPWCRQDLFFLQDSLRSGRSFGEVASFLSRCEDEVRKKAEELGITNYKVRGVFSRHRVSPDKAGARRLQNRSAAGPAAPQLARSPLEAGRHQSEGKAV
jgi:hypothetical protein